MLIDDLKAFVSVMDNASLTKAADKMFLTQSAVSRRIQRLEQTLNTELFDRASRPPAPTAMGYRVYEEAVRLLQDAKNLLEMTQEGGVPSGRFRLGFTQIVSDTVVFDTVTQLRAAFPALEMQIVTKWSSELEMLLVRGELDAATLLMPSTNALPAGLKGELISDLDMLVVQSKAKPIVSAETDLKSVSCKEWILNPKGCGYRAVLESAIGGLGQVLKVGIDTHAASIQMRMVAAGLGLGLLPKRLLSESPLARELAVVNVDEFHLKMHVWIAHSSQPGNLRQAISMLVDGVVESFRPPTIPT